MTRTLTIGEAVTIQRGTTYKSALIGQPGPVLLGLGTILRNGGFRGDSLRTYGGDSPDKLLVRPGELYASLKDVTQSADLLGAVARVPVDGPTGRLTQDTVRLDLTGVVAADYLYWVMRTPQYRGYCRAHATGTTNLGLPREDFFAFAFPAPTERTANIVALLGALDDKIRSNHRAIDLAEALGDALFAQSVGDTAPLSDVARLTMGSSPPGISYNEDGEGVPFYQGVRDFGRRFPGLRVWTRQPVRMAEPNDTLVSVRAPVGNLNRVAVGCCIGRGLAAVHSTSPSTVHYALRAAGELWEPFQQEGTVFGAINRADLSSARLPWPSPEDLAEVEGRLSVLDLRIASSTQEIERLVGLRDALLPELLSGRIGVPEAAAVVQDGTE